jgi:dGTPase
LLRWQQQRPTDPHQQAAQHAQHWPGIKGLLEYLLSDESEPGTRSEAELLDGFRSVAISKFVGAVELQAHDDQHFEIQLADPLGLQSKFLQRLIWDYVILSPRLATQQAGQIRVVDGLFGYFLESLENMRLDRIPTRFREDTTRLMASAPAAKQMARLAIDIVATLTEPEAISLYKRISGYDGGSVLDLIN